VQIFTFLFISYRPLLADSVRWSLLSNRKMFQFVLGGKCTQNWPFKGKNNLCTEITNTEYRIQNTEYRIQNTEYRIPNTEYRIQNTEYRIQNIEYRIQNTEYRIQNTEYRIQNTEYRIQNTEYIIKIQNSENTKYKTKILDIYRMKNTKYGIQNTKWKTHSKMHIKEYRKQIAEQKC